jgi:hypothetical protein
LGFGMMAAWIRMVYGWRWTGHLKESVSLHEVAVVWIAFPCVVFCFNGLSATTCALQQKHS